jgi:secondary thiamine-phosphate synthase enzyme
MLGCSEQVPIKNKALSLGTWQAIFFCEFDGPRSRRVVVQVRGE